MHVYYHFLYIYSRAPEVKFLTKRCANVFCLKNRPKNAKVWYIPTFKTVASEFLSTNYIDSGVESFSCNGKPDGLYGNPTDCTQNYVICIGGIQTSSFVYCVRIYIVT